MRHTLLQILAICLLIAPGTAFRAGAQTHSKDVDSILIDAVALYNAQDYQGAMKLLRPLASAYPDNDAVFYYLGLCAVYTNDAEEAETYFQQAVSLDSTNFWYRDYLARLYMSTRRPELAIDIYDALIRDFPKNYDLYYNLVNLYAQQGKPDKMLSTLDEIEEVQGLNENVTMTRYEVLMRQEKPDEAFAALEKFNEEYSSPSILATMGDFKLSQYEDSLALQYYNDALACDSDCGQALVGKAEAYRMRRSYPEFFEAMHDFIGNEALPMQPKTQYLGMMLQHGDPQFMRNFRPQLDSLMGSYLALAPKDSIALQTMGSYYFNTGRSDKAKETLSLNAELYPQSLSARAMHVQLLSELQEWQALSDESEKAWADFPDEPAFLEYKSIAAYQMKDYAGVIDATERMMAAVPGDTSVALQSLATIGDMYYHLGDTKKAYSSYEKALKINPRYVMVLNNYAYFLSLEGRNLKKAYSMSKTAIEEEPDNATYLDTFAWILHLQGKDIEAKPFFKHAMLYGGKESATMLDHYAEVLFCLGEYDLAKVYWNMAIKKDTDGEIPDLKERSASKLKSVGK